MVVEEVGGDAAVELGDVVAPLAAKVVDLVAVLVLGLEQSPHLVQVVMVNRLHVLRRVTHGDITIRDVTQV